MGQTLTHGVYLPDEGERNCYNGLAANWQILDNSVGTIAEHTSALSGKAPLVHTHTKSDITDFPVLANVATSGSYNDLSNIPASFTPASHTHGNLTNDGKVGTAANKPLITGTNGVVQAGSFGTAANTFCEGNDSRLSDARTPVAHTHGKADITDLFNSANTWTENNTFSKQVCLTKVNDTSLKSQNSRAALGETNLSGDTYTQISFEDKNGDNFGYLRQIYGADGNNGFHFFVRNKFLNSVPDTAGTIDYAYFGLRLNPDKSKEAVFKASLRPYDSTYNYNLGDSTYQWNNLYAKNYFYNGVAWGLDKINVWSENNRFYKNAPLSGISSLNDPTLGFSANSTTIFFNTRGSTNYPSYGTFLFAGYSTGAAPDRLGQFKLVRSTDKKGETNDGYIPDSSFNLWRVAPHYLVMDMMEAVRVTNDGAENSLKPITNNATDLGTSTNKWKTLNGCNPGALGLPSGDYEPLNTKDWDLTGATSQSYTPTVNGWLFISIQNIAGNYLSIVAGRGAISIDGTGAQNGLRVMLPVIANASVGITVKTGIIFAARFYPMQGNVS